MQEEERPALEVAADPALVRAELVDDLLVPVGHQVILGSTAKATSST